MNTVNKKTTLQFNDDFFKEEVRCGFTVTEKQKKIWAIEIDLLDQLTQVCKKYNINFSVISGTLLGTVRHKGFIPWDDDLDVCMTRENYERLLEVAPIEFKHPYFLQTALSDTAFFCGYGRLRNSLTTGWILDYKSVDYNQGIYIDVYVVDGYVYDEKLLDKQLFKRDLLSMLANAYCLNTVSNSRVKHLIKSALQNILHYTLCKLLSYKTIVRWYDKNLSKYSSKSDRVSLLTHDKWVIKKYWCKLKDLESPQYLPFENIMVPVPSNFHDILCHMYGNYMEFPPEKERGEWHNNIIYFDPDIPYKEYFKQIEHKN